MAITHSLLLYVNISVNGLPCIECSNWRCNMYRDYCNNYHRKQLLVALPTLVCNYVKLITSFLSLRKCFKLVEYGESKTMLVIQVRNEILHGNNFITSNQVSFVKELFR
jgi:hypothetical protein